jgi:hypothetical protein
MIKPFVLAWLGSHTTRQAIQNQLQLAAELLAHLGGPARLERNYGVRPLEVGLLEPVKITSEALAGQWDAPAAAMLERDAAVLKAVGSQAEAAAEGLAEAQVRGAEITQVIEGLVTGMLGKKGTRKEREAVRPEALKLFQRYQETQEASKGGNLRVTRFEGLPENALGGAVVIADLVREVLSAWKGKPTAPAPAPAGGGRRRGPKGPGTPPAPATPPTPGGAPAPPAGGTGTP